MPINKTTYDTQAVSPGLKFITGRLTNPGVAPFTPVCSNPAVAVTPGPNFGEYVLTLPAVGEIDITHSKFEATYQDVVTANLPLRFANQLRIIDVTGNQVTVKCVYMSSGLNSNVIRKEADAAAGTAYGETTLFSVQGGPGADISINSVVFIPDSSYASVAGDCTYTVRSRDASGGTPVVAGSGNWPAGTAFSKGANLISFPGPILNINESLTIEIVKAGAGLAIPSGVFYVDYFGTVSSGLGYDFANARPLDIYNFSIAIKNSSGR